MAIIMISAYFAAAWLAELISAGLLSEDGKVRYMELSGTWYEFW
jgi:hypothetical protein